MNANHATQKIQFSNGNSVAIATSRVIKANPIARLQIAQKADNPRQCVIFLQMCPHEEQGKKYVSEYRYVGYAQYENNGISVKLEDEAFFEFFENKTPKENLHNAIVNEVSSSLKSVH